MALLPADPKQQRSVIAIALAIAGFYAYWSFVHSPRVEQIETLTEQVEGLAQRNQTARVQNLRGGLDELEERAIEYQRHVRRLEELIPASEEVAPLIDQITLDARSLGVTVADVSPQPDEPGQHYTRHSYSLQVVGDYHDVGRLFTAIASGSRIITPVRASVFPFDQGQGRLGDYESPITVSFEIETYILPDPGMSAAVGAPESEGDR